MPAGFKGDLGLKVWRKRRPHWLPQLIEARLNLPQGLFVVLRFRVF